MKTSILLLFAALTVSCGTVNQSDQGLSIFLEGENRNTDFALENAGKLYPGVLIRRVEQEHQADYILRLENIQGAPGSYHIQHAVNGTGGHILAGDFAGAMYAILDLAEAIHHGYAPESVAEGKHAPSLSHRVIKYNLPWSSYRQGKALDLHMETCRDTIYWESFLDMMVKNRYNTLSLWNMHPFTYLIRPEKYPEACPFDEEELKNWQDFWHALFRMAADRGIECILVNWNIFTSPAFAGHHGLDEYLVSGNFWGNAENSKLIEDYTREVVRQVIDEYPDLAGFGLTLGERMGGMSAGERRDWIDRTLITGMRQANRKVKLLYRAPLSAGLSSHGTTSRSTEALTRVYLDTLSAAAETVISFKYNWSHGHSSPRLFIVHGGKLSDAYWNPPPENYSVLWTVRNEDFFVHRWGQPDFVRAFLDNNMATFTSGCILGSECYIPAKDYFTREDVEVDFDYAYQRQWLWYAIWGRLLYDRATPDSHFAAMLNTRFGIGYGDRLLECWKRASDYYHLFNSFFKGTWDATNYAESFTAFRRDSTGDSGSGIITMDLLGNRPVLDTSKYINIQDYILSGEKLSGGRQSPLELAGQLEDNAAFLKDELEHIREHHSIPPALKPELRDLEVLARMQVFFAARIRATLLLGRHLLLEIPLDREGLEQELLASIELWKEIKRLRETDNNATIPYLFNENLNYADYLVELESELGSYADIKGFKEHDLK